MEKLLKVGAVVGVTGIPLAAGCALILVVTVVSAVIFSFFAVLLAWLGGTSPENSIVPPTIHGMPANGVITASYHDPDYFARFGVQHQGVDIANNTPATFLYSTVDNGVVSKVGYDAGGYGFYVVITDAASGWTTLYGHMLAPGVTMGESVGFGDTIGIMGRSGNSTGIHVHYEIRRPDKTRVDPALSSGCCG